jgi:hypothetical protein
MHRPSLNTESVLAVPFGNLRALSGQRTLSGSAMSIQGNQSEPLKLARGRLEAGRKLADQQRAMVTKLQSRGLCTEVARHQLDLFEITLKLFEEDYQKMKEGLDARLKK